jgi:hypothetical protein
MKQRIAKVSLIISIALFFLGFLIMCFCPGWYLTTAAFSGVAICLGNPRTRNWGIFWIIAALILSVLNHFGQIKEHEKMQEILKRFEEKQKTNQIAQPNP